MDFTLDADINIPTGIAASPEQVADMVADPGSPVTVEVVAKLDAKQRPDADLFAARISAAKDAGKLTKAQATALTKEIQPK